jgi:hypothetical protein
MARDGMRQELRDLAKLAGTMPKEPPAPPSSAAQPSSSARTAESGPPSASRVTVPPAILAGERTSVPATTPSSPPPSTPRKGRRTWAAVTGATLALALVGGVVLGSRWVAARHVSSAPTDPQRTAATGVAAVPAPPAAAPAPPTAVVADPSPTTVSAATPTATPASPSTSTPTSTPASTPRVAAGQHPPPRSAKPKTASTQPSLVAVVPQANGPGHDSLTDAINKSIAAPKPPKQ